MNGEVTMTNDELIKEAEELLIASGRAAKNRIRTRSDYKGKKYLLETGSKLIEQIQRDLPDKWTQWVEQTHAFICSGRERMKRPTFDRIDSNGDYSLDNLDFLPLDLHMNKDNLVGITVYDFKNQSFKKYKSMTAAEKSLDCVNSTVSRHCDSGVRFKHRYLIQAEGLNGSKNSNRAKRKQKMLAVATVVMEEFDDDGNFVREFTTQMTGEMLFPTIELKRQGI